MATKVEEAAKTAIEVCMAVKPGEKVLIVTDKPTQEIGQALYNAADKITETTMVVIKPTGVSGKEPPKEVALLMKKFDVILCPTEYSLTHTYAVKNARKGGARVVTLPGITLDIFTRTIDIDYNEMKKNLSKVRELLVKSRKAKVTTSSGTNMIFHIRPKSVMTDSGLFHKPGDAGNLPAGEVDTAPYEKKTNGVMVIDSMGEVKPKTKVYVRNGLVQEVEGDKWLREQLWKYKNARYIGELGIGMNPKAKIIRNILEDEKVLGTCHMAFGSSFFYPGGTIKSEIHWDAILLKPTIWFDDKKIMDSGELLV